MNNSNNDTRNDIGILESDDKGRIYKEIQKDYLIRVNILRISITRLAKEELDNKKIIEQVIVSLV